MKFNSLMPELYVTHYDKSLAFYTKILGFSIEYERINPSFAFLSYNGAQLMIQELRSGEAEKLQLEHPFGRGINFEIETPNVQIIIENLHTHDYPLSRDVKESWRHIGLIGKESGSKEILVHDPDGYELRFSEDLGERDST